jgi:hypothetical protein
MRHVLIVPVLAVVSCATSETNFRGAAKVPNGVAGCQARCSSYGMELAGMVALGDYSDGCICEVAGRRSASAGAASSAAAAAVMEEIRLQKQRQNAGKRVLVQPEPGPIFLPPRVRNDGAEQRRECATQAEASITPELAEAPR